jgi:ubiquinone/menaquinone biosynthesis C-methylase UbiE
MVVMIMSSEKNIPIDKETLDLFAKKGAQIANTVQSGNANALKVRRVMQLINDFSKKPFENLQILDLACGEGVYAIEAALRGASVIALDARTERMNEGASAAKRLGLSNLRFSQEDIRNITTDSHGGFDIVLFLGILYHLNESDALATLKNIYNITREFVIIDTHIALTGDVKIEIDDHAYEGHHYVEHRRSDPEELRRSRQQASLDNSTSFWFTKQSLFRLLEEVGFTSVCECNVPLEPFKPINRITIIASRGKPVSISSYPWINDKTEQEIEQIISTLQPKINAISSIKQYLKSSIKRVLRLAGFKI